MPAYVLAATGWHPGVIGIVAARIAERHHRPVVLVALPGEGGGLASGSGRSILEIGLGEHHPRCDRGFTGRTDVSTFDDRCENTGLILAHVGE